jgi:DNA-binding MarR family transcriptional regulator
VSRERRRLVAGAWSALAQVHAAVTPRLDYALQAATGVPLNWYGILAELTGAPGRRLTMSELGDRVVLSRTRVSRLVGELEAAGLVEREDNPDDGRSAFAALTADGLACYRAAAPHYLASIENEFAGVLTDRELASVAKAMDKVAGAQ